MADIWKVKPTKKLITFQTAHPAVKPFYPVYSDVDIPVLQDLSISSILNLTGENIIL
jgi:hypothetical protein